MKLGNIFDISKVIFWFNLLIYNGIGLVSNSIFLVIYNEIYAVSN